jgi:hypothetical protein
MFRLNVTGQEDYEEEGRWPSAGPENDRLPSQQ